MLKVGLSALFGGLEAIIDDNMQKGLRSVHRHTTTNATVVIVDVVTGTYEDLQNNPELYDWQVEAIPAKLVQPVVSQKYGHGGFEGAYFEFKERDQLHHLSKKRMIFKRVEDEG